MQKVSVEECFSRQKKHKKNITSYGNMYHFQSSKNMIEQSYYH